MEPRVLSSDITIGNKTYRLNKCDARTACWMFSFLGAKIEKEGGSIFGAIGKCTRVEFDEIQTIALKHTFFIDNKDGNEFPIAIIAANGTWIDKELGENSSALMKLTSEYLGFVIKPFLVESGLNSQI